MEVVKITKKVYKAVGCEKGHLFGTFAHFKELRESSNLSVQKTCFCCRHKFQPEDFISLACFDKGMGNKFLCQKCKESVRQRVRFVKTWKSILKVFHTKLMIR